VHVLEFILRAFPKVLDGVCVHAGAWIDEVERVVDCGMGKTSDSRQLTVCCPLVAPDSGPGKNMLLDRIMGSSVAASRRLTSTRKASSVALSMPPKTHRWQNGRAPRLLVPSQTIWHSRLFTRCAPDPQFASDGPASNLCRDPCAY